MEFDNSDLKDFASKIKSYNKKQKIKQHKTVKLIDKEKTEKNIGRYVVKLLKNEPILERVPKSSCKEFFTTMMQRHKRRITPRP